MANEMDLGQLFALADAIGDQYLTQEEIAQRQAELDELANIEMLCLMADSIDG